MRGRSGAPDLLPGRRHQASGRQSADCKGSERIRPTRYFGQQCRRRAAGALRADHGRRLGPDFCRHMRSVFLGMQAAIPEMRKGGGGSIISISSNAGLRGMPPLHAYSAAKAGVINLTESVARLVGPDFIRINCISPGLIATPAARSGVPDADKVFAKAQPIPKAGEPEDIAAAALFLASDESRWITGTTMVVDGGQNTAPAVPLVFDK